MQKHRQVIAVWQKLWGALVTILGDFAGYLRDFAFLENPFISLEECGQFQPEKLQKFI